MAGIDKIYGTKEQWEELFRYLAINRPQYCKFLYSPWGSTGEPMMISNFPVYADRWLWKHCPLLWVKDRLKEQYNGAPK
jgi:hypothetical protein